MGTRRKKPANIEVPRGKAPQHENFTPSDEQRPVWRTGRMEFVHPYGWHVIGPETLGTVRAALRHFEACSWDQILVKDKKKNHAIPVDRLAKDAQKRLAQLGLEQVQELVSLSSGLGGKRRIFGIRDGRVLDLLWWDPQHLVCPSKKKHT